MSLAVSSSGVTLVEAQRVLGLFAQGIAGRYLHLKPSETLTGHFRPNGVTTDGSAIYLPSSIELFDSRRDNLGVYRIAVLHQVGLFEAGTYDFSMQEARARIADLPPEAPRLGDPGVGLARFFGLWLRPQLMRWLFMTLEDLRVDRILLRRFPGARSDLARVFAQALATRPPLESLTPQAALLEGLLRYSLGQDAEQLVAQDSTGMLSGMIATTLTLDSDAASVYESAAAAVRCYKLLAMPSGFSEDTESAQTEATGRFRPPQTAGSDGLDGDDGQLPPGTSDFRGQVLPELVQRQMRISAITAQLEAASAMSLEPETQQADTEAERQRQIEADRVALYRAFGQLQSGARSFLYDEWDYLGQRYLPGWCRVHEKRLRGNDFEFIGRVRQRHAALMRTIRRQFMAVRPESYRRERPVRDGEQIDLDAIIEAVIDRRNGQLPDDRVYIRQLRGEREVACAFLLDMSASTDYPIPDPDLDGKSVGALPVADQEDAYLWAVSHSPDDLPASAQPVRRVIDVARESMALMSEALHLLGDSHAVYGFSGQGREEVEFYVAKDFNDPVSERSWSAIAEMKPRRSTRMGAAIRHAVRRLNMQPTRTKLLIMISDGYPEDSDYGPDRHDHEYGIQDTARALREAERAGVRTFCVTVDRAGHDYLRRMCEAERYLVIDEIEALPDALSKLYRVLTN